MKSLPQALIRAAGLVLLLALGTGCNHTQYIPATLRGTPHDQLAHLTPKWPFPDVDGVRVEEVRSSADIYLAPGFHTINSRHPGAEDYIYLEKGSTFDGMQSVSEQSGVVNIWLFAGHSPEALKQLGPRKALVKIEFPKQVIRGADGRWQWDTIFRELGGQVGYAVTGMGLFIDSQGVRWAGDDSSLLRRDLAVEGGGVQADSLWCEGERFVDGYICFTWSGVDAKGRSFRISTRVHLVDSREPTPGK